MPLSTDTSKKYIPAQHWIRPQNQLPTKPKFLTTVMPHTKLPKSSSQREQQDTQRSGCACGEFWIRALLYRTIEE